MDKREAHVGLLPRTMFLEALLRNLSTQTPFSPAPFLYSLHPNDVQAISATAMSPTPPPYARRRPLVPAPGPRAATDEATSVARGFVRNEALV